MEDVLSTEIPGDFGEALKTGVLLCEVINKIEPGKIPKISTNTMPFPQRENIKAFTDEGLLSLTPPHSRLYGESL